MNFRFLIAGAALALLATPAAAQAPAPVAPQSTAAPDEAAAPQEQDPDKVVCRQVSPPTGTRIRGRNRTRVCMTAKDWERMNQEAQDALREIPNEFGNEEFIRKG